MRIKSKYTKDTWEKVSIGLRAVVLDMDHFLQKHFDYELTITEGFTTKEMDASVGRKHAVHREGRGVDIRTKDWNRQMFDAFVKEFSWLDAFGAVSEGSNQRRALVFHGYGANVHLHLQIGRDVLKSFNEQYK
jgi:hypothetical protein